MVSCKNKCPLKANRHNDDYTLGYCDGIDFGYNKAIDDAINAAKELNTGNLIDRLEQLKAGNNEK